MRLHMPKIFVIEILVVLVVSIWYFRAADRFDRIIDEFVSEILHSFRWTITRRRWTKALKALAAKGFSAWSSCKVAISNRRQVVRKALSAICALWFERTRSRGRASVPPSAANRPIHLKATQQGALDALESTGSLTRSDYERLAGVSRSQAAYDLAELVSAGLLRRVGNGRATRYLPAREGHARRTWTPERIRSELEAFCSGRETWPSAAEFKSAGRGDLYVAVSRYGGVAHWARELELSRSGSRSVGASPAPLRRKLAWAGAGVLATVAVGAVTIGVNRGTAPRSRPAAAPAAVPAVVDESMHPRGARASGGTTRRSVRSVARKAQTARAVPTKRAVRSETAPQETLISYSASSSHAATAGRATRSWNASKPVTGTGPAPLPAPAGTGGPGPLKAP